MTQTGKTCANKIVPDQTAPLEEQSDQCLFVCLQRQQMFRHKDGLVEIINRKILKLIRKCNVTDIRI